jgi:PAS domain S-box-containing protein/diguanylate cyclase (GGDEF)-like protein
MSTMDPDDAVVEQALRDGELHKALLDHLEAGIYMVDRRRRILYWNRGAEQISGYLAQEVAGHYCQGDLLMHCDAAGMGMCGKGCPLSTVMVDGKPREHTLFLRHRHGHRIPVRVRSCAIYDSQGAITGAVEVFEQLTAPASIDRRALQEHGCLDELAQVANRAYGEFKLGQALAALRTFGITFGWLAVGLDDVEGLEHRYGHGLVDAAVKMMARTLDSNLGPVDSLTRWDRTEFRIEVHSCWGQGLDELTEKLRVLARTSNLEWWGDPVRMTVSIGGVMAEAGNSAESLESRVTKVLANSRSGRAGGGADTPGNDFLKLGDERCLP